MEDRSLKSVWTSSLVHHYKSTESMEEVIFNAFLVIALTDNWEVHKISDMRFPHCVYRSATLYSAWLDYDYLVYEK